MLRFAARGREAGADPGPLRQGVRNCKHRAHGSIKSRAGMLEWTSRLAGMSVPKRERFPFNLGLLNFRVRLRGA
jgi:hypothetical protein